MDSCLSGDASTGATRGSPATLLAVAEGDRYLLLRVMRSVTGFLIRSGAYDVRDSWDDLCQDVLCAVIKNARQGGLRDGHAFFAYVIGIARHKLADCLTRHRTQLQRLDPTDSMNDVPSHGRDAEILLDIRRACAELDERHRNVIQAIYIQGYSYEQAAERLALPLGTLKRRQTAALRMLRQRLAVDGPGRLSAPRHHFG